MMSNKSNPAPEFPFPSNGKAYRKWFWFVSQLPPQSFHSLQTGKPIASISIVNAQWNYLRVSIPFKRESLSQERYGWRIWKRQIMFPFPSNGKAYRKQADEILKNIKYKSFHSLQTGKPIASDTYPNRWRTRSKVSIPFKRESLSQGYHRRQNTCPRTRSFHSLQTGKPIASLMKLTFERNWTHLFPFPSNGKAYRKSRCGSARDSRADCFHSLQTGKPIASYRGRRQCVLGVNSFHSLQTGKPIARHLNTHEHITEMWSFHSLQTGTPIARKFRHIRLCVPVSFHSLQTGKPIASGRFRTGQGNIRNVSIPFKRESLSQEYDLIPTTQEAFDIVFPFPSNGKAYRKFSLPRPHHSPVVSYQVSIPFKRESLSQVIKWQKAWLKKKVSIPFKRESLSQVNTAFLMTGLGKLQFPFPSNGKAYRKSRICLIYRAKFNCVSIPFKRESLSQGRAHRLHPVPDLRFHSLQTGKPIASHRQVFWGYEQLLVSIPFKRESLSQGFEICEFRSLWSVSIPFKRESLSQVQMRTTPRQMTGFVSIPFKRESLSQETPF